MPSKDELEKMKVADLKQLCKDKGLSQGGVKADLVTRLAEAEEKPAEEKPAEAAEKKDTEVAPEAAAEKDAKAEDVKEEKGEEAAAEAEEPAEVKKDEAKDEEMKEEEAAKDEEEAAKEETKDEADVEMKEEAKEEEVVTKEVQRPEEEDAPEDSRPRVKAEDVYISAADSTPNTMPSADGNLLMTLCSGGFQYLLAGARCSVGIKSGRYMFEVKITETLSPAEGSMPRQVRTPQPRQLVRVGFSTASPSALLDDGADKAYFDCDGNFVQNYKRDKVSARFFREQWVGVLLNLDASTPNANTMTLYSDGRRISDIMPLPEELVGKVLYPTVSFKNVTLQVNFGPKPKTTLPFKCRMLKDAAAEDVEVTPPRKDGKCEVLFPIGLPDQGVFDWLDNFLEKSPSYLELSDRKVLDWARKSLLFRQKDRSRSESSNDKPGMFFGIPFMDDMSVQKILGALAPALRRDFVVMELNSNLLAAERKAALKRFPSTDFKKIAVVVMGEPPEEFKAKAQELILAEKVQKAEKEKQELAESRSKRARYSEYEKKDEDWSKSGADWQDPEKKEEPSAEAEGEKKDEEADAEKKDSMEVDEDKPVELTEEEKKLWYYKRETPDLSSFTLARNFASFGLPDSEEGFDEIRYEWSNNEKSLAHMKEFVMELKKTQRAEDLEPSEWFKDKHSEWRKVLDDWRKKQSQFRDELKRKPLKKEKKDEKKEEKEKEKEKKDDAEEKKADEEVAEKKDEDEEKKEEKEEKDDKDKEEAKKDDEDADVEEEPDVDAVKDILDIGEGKPLFANFAYEDWVLLGLRYELHLLVHAFKKDLDDPDRPGFSESHLAFYYDKYYKKNFSTKWFNVATLAELVELIKDAITLHPDTSFLQAVNDVDAPLDKFVRLTEENRRERQRCIDAGDETANLKFQRAAPPPPRGGHSDRPRSGDRRGGGDGRRPPPVGSSRDGGSRGPPRGGPPPRYNQGSDRGSDRGRKGGGDRGYGGAPPSRGGDYGSAKGSHKRPYGGGAPPPASYPPAKQPRYDRGGSGGPQRSSYPPPPPYSSSGGGKGGYSGRR